MSEINLTVGLVGRKWQNGVFLKPRAALADDNPEMFTQQ